MKIAAKFEAQSIEYIFEIFVYLCPDLWWKLGRTMLPCVVSTSHMSLGNKVFAKLRITELSLRHVLTYEIL